mmetsp:Transcript_22845/g.44416  ORF Transcript_22845/g.44416 Transcript_22845/m.44416 type:complete len:93 (+) Transcript_22845:248-526(+)
MTVVDLKTELFGLFLGCAFKHPKDRLVPGSNKHHGQSAISSSETPKVVAAQCQKPGPAPPPATLLPPGSRAAARAIPFHGVSHPFRLREHLH